MTDRLHPARSTARRGAAAVATLGFLLATAVHAAAVMGVDLTGGSKGAFFALHVGIFPLWFAAVPTVRREFAGEPPRDLAKLLIGSVPRGWRIAFYALFVYAVVNFGLTMVATEGGVPEHRGDAYALVSHGRVLRTLTLEEYEATVVREVRGFSGHWMLFYLLPVIVFAVRRRGPDAASRLAREG